jgi:hypothetical protein
MEITDPLNQEKLEQIFLPHIVNGRHKLEAEGNKLIHYTTAENAFKIIESDCVWMRSPTCMNDYMEITHGYNMVLKYFSQSHNKNSFSESLNSCHAGLADEIYNGFDSWWEKIKNDTFIASISSHFLSENEFGRLSMWRAYSKNSEKAGIVFNFPPNQKAQLGPILSPALYLNHQELEEMLNRIILTIRKHHDYLSSLQRETIAGSVIIALVIFAVCLKHPGFKEEHEWRVIYLPTVTPRDDIINRSIETIDGVPQIVYKFPLRNNKELGIVGFDTTEIIDKIIIGPTQYPLAMFDAFSLLLLNKGISDPAKKIQISHIPLRT